jgi:hypothetical protein
MLVHVDIYELISSRVVFLVLAPLKSTIKWRIHKQKKMMFSSQYQTCSAAVCARDWCVSHRRGTQQTQALLSKQEEAHGKIMAHGSEVENVMSYFFAWQSSKKTQGNALFTTNDHQYTWQTQQHYGTWAANTAVYQTLSTVYFGHTTDYCCFWRVSFLLWGFILSLPFTQWGIGMDPNVMHITHRICTPTKKLCMHNTTSIP